MTAHRPDTLSHFEVFLVPRQKRVDLLGGGFANDDEHDITGLHPVERISC
jgi:hypothetical protein